VLLLWSSWIALFFVRGRDPRDLATIGRMPLAQSHVSSVIRIDSSYHYYPCGIGYDGQYNYFLALDPANARYYMDYPSYRYTAFYIPCWRGSSLAATQRSSPTRCRCSTSWPSPAARSWSRTGCGNSTSHPGLRSSMAAAPA
jgi:hypothetical protein